MLKQTERMTVMVGYPYEYEFSISKNMKYVKLLLNH